MSGSEMPAPVCLPFRRSSRVSVGSHAQLVGFVFTITFVKSLLEVLLGYAWAHCVSFMIRIRCAFASIGFEPHFSHSLYSLSVCSLILTRKYFVAMRLSLTRLPSGHAWDVLRLGDISRVIRFTPFIRLLSDIFPFIPSAIQMDPDRRSRKIDIVERSYFSAIGAMLEPFPCFLTFFFLVLVR